MTRLSFTSIILGLAAIACGVAAVSQDDPKDASSDAASQSRVAAAESAKPAEAPERFDLSKYRGVLAAPALKAVQEAIDEDRHEEASSLLLVYLAEEKPEPFERARLEYVLGREYRAAGDLVKASESFEASASTEWILRDDARLLQAEIQVEQEAAAESLATLKHVDEERRGARYWGIAAAANDQLKKSSEAAAAWALVVELRPSSEARVAWAEALLARDTGSGQKPEQALKEARRARLGQSDKSAVTARALAVEKKAQALGAKPAVEDERDLQLQHMRGLVDKRLFKEAETFMATVTLPTKIEWDAFRCEWDYLRAKTLAGRREWGAGADRLLAPASRCSADAELHAKILFNAGKFAAADARHTTAVKHYAKLEELYPGSTLADDSRLRAARSYLRAGSVAKFTQLLMDLPEAYPQGDMTMEGVLELALYRMERRDWSGASQVLERGARVVRDGDSARGHEVSGRERYFLARCQAELGQTDTALDEYEAIVQELPLSYYMLHAYSRLRAADQARATAALQKARLRAEKEPFSFPYRPEYDSEEFRRGVELLSVGEVGRGRAVLGQLGLAEGTDDSLLWGLALLHDRAGDVQLAHRIARGRLSDWFAHYPEGDWVTPWQIGFPRPYLSIVEKESAATGVPEWLIYGVMREESTFDAKVVSHADAYGLMQLILPTARGVGKRAGIPYSAAALKRPSVNIALGSRVLESLGRRFKTNPWLAIPGYNAGPGRPARWLRERPDMDFDVWVELIPFRETRRYTKRVLASRAAYAFLYYPEQAAEALILPKRLSSP